MNNEILASIFEPHVCQLCVVWPLCWKHEPYGNWYVSFNLETGK